MINLKAKWKVHIISLLLLICISCIAETNIFSEINPEYRGATYDNILIITSFDISELDGAIENKIKEASKYYYIDVTEYKDIFFAGNDYSAYEIDSILAKYKINAILYIRPQDAGTNKQHINKKTIITSNRNRITASEYGGYDIEKPWLAVSSELYDALSGDLVWYATCNSSGNAFSDFNYLAKSVARKTIIQLENDGLIKIRPKI